MKKIAFLFILLSVCIVSHAQKKNGTVYSEHETIEKTKELWSAFVNGDSEAMLNLLADSVHLVINGNYNKRPKEFFKGPLKWWSGVDNLKAVDDSPAFPDAIEYKEGGIWVQDWLRLTGTHRESGININIQVHNLYGFNEDGLISTYYQYFDDSFYEEINNSFKTTENGKVYKNHPYIVTVRKLMNVLCAMDLDSWSGFFAPNAKLSNIMTEWGKTYSVEEVREYYEGLFPKIESIQMKQVGYPDCIYYEDGDYHVVYSWWVNTWHMKDGTKKEFPSKFSHAFNKDGKIIYDRLYVSSNHLE